MDYPQSLWYRKHMSIFSLLATFALGGVSGYLIWAGFKTFKRKPPKALVPAVIGATIIALQHLARIHLVQPHEGGIPARGRGRRDLLEIRLLAALDLPRAPGQPLHRRRYPEVAAATPNSRTTS